MNMLSSTNNNGSRPDYACPKCRDQEGQFYRDDNGAEYWRDCECVIKKRIQRLMESSQITEEFQKKGFKNFNQEGRPEPVVKAFHCARDYAKKFKEIERDRQNSIALLGRPGCGKTHLLMAVSNNLISMGIEVTYFPWTEGFNELKDDFEKLNTRVKRLQETRVLFIDDLLKGGDKPTNFELKQLFAIINYRYLENKPILISSERSIAEICKIDEAIGSRINEMCRDYKVTLTGGIELNYRLVQ